MIPRLLGSVDILALSIFAGPSVHPKGVEFISPGLARFWGLPWV